MAIQKDIVINRKQYLDIKKKRPQPNECFYPEYL